MSTISISELKKKPAKQWLKSAGKDDLVITSKGKPAALSMSDIDAEIAASRRARRRK